MHAQTEAPPPIAAPPHRAPSRYVWIAAALATAVLAAVSFVPALRTVDLTPLRGSLASLVRTHTGRAVTLGGGPAVRLSLSPVLIAQDVAFANAPWGSRPAMLHVKRVELTVRALEALLGVLGIRIRSSGGATDLTASLDATGSAVHGWMESLDGDARVVVGKGRLEGGALNLGADVLAQVVAAVNPFHRSESSTELRCAVINFGVERGVVGVDRRVGIETSRLDLVASGTADFGKEVLDFDRRSRATQGLGVGLASFAGAARVRGPLTHPSLGLNPVGAAESTATTVGAAAATGGLSIIAKRLWERLFARSPCATAPKEGPKKAVAPKRSRARR